MRNDELTELLSLADNDHEPPRGFAEELLASLIDEVRRPAEPRAESSMPRTVFDSANDDQAELELLLDDDDVVRPLDIGLPEPRRRLLMMGAAVAAAVVIVVAISVGSNRDLVESGPVGADGTSAEPHEADEPVDPRSAPFAAASDGQVCRQLIELALESGFLGNERAELTGVQLGQLSDLLTEMDSRGLLNADPSDAIGALLYARLTTEQNASDRSTARDRARSLVLQLRLGDLICTVDTEGG